MRNLFYPRLALSNLKLNRRFYVPYLLTVILSCAMYYNVNFVRFNAGLVSIGGDITVSTLRTLLLLGSWVVAIFSVIFLFYTHSFLIKQRKRELGLYSVLGMNKGNIARVLLWEELLITVGGIALGLSVGILISKLVMLFLCAVMRFDVLLGFEVSVFSVWQSVVVFGVIGVLNLLNSLIRTSFVNPIELLRGSNVGEREPKANWVMAALGVITLAVGYGLAVTIKDPIEALAYFFVAVILVIIGTYALFTSGSIALLKILRRNKNYYYKLKHFTAISGMIYRMRQNAAGLASICILCTMVLVIFSTTVCLNAGFEKALLDRYPAEFCVPNMEDKNGTRQIGNLSDDEVEARVLGCLTENGYTASNARWIKYLQIYHYNGKAVSGNGYYLIVLTSTEYEQLTGKTIMLAPGEAAYSAYGDVQMDENALKIGDVVYQARKTEIMVRPFWARGYIDSVLTVVLSSWEEAERAYGDVIEEMRYSYFCFDVDAPVSMQPALSEKMEDALRVDVVLKDGARIRVLNCNVENREMARQDFLGFYGGLLFIGVFLGLLFVMATALIIYYKQLSEGYDDKKRYEIMQKVGMTKQEVRLTIRSQILTVFFLPLGAAVVHLIFAFPMIRKMLALFHMTDISLFAVCTAGTVLLLAGAYAFIYAMTARMYYHIVEA